MSLPYNPNEEGRTHINIYSRSKTLLGKLCSNFAHTPFVHPTLGAFASMEGFYYYVSTGERYEQLRELSGYNAKSTGKAYSRVNRPDFESVLMAGLEAKFHYHREQFSDLFEQSVDEEGVPLPFVHYYAYGQANEKIVVPKGNGWLLDGWTAIRARVLND